jgi:type I restriction enzyme R subunit
LSINNRYITPALEQSGWKKEQMRMEYSFTAGRVIVRGNSAQCGSKKRADYVLFYKPNILLAIVEAKDDKHNVGDGMQQAIEYAQMLDIPFAYSANGKQFLEHDIAKGTEREIPINGFPNPDELWARHKNERGFTEEQEKIITTPDYFDIVSKRAPRYYQRIAINKTIEAIAKGQNRVLLVMATGTGKTYTAFQIIHRLWKSGIKKKILYLADRNILIDQTMQQDFKPFERVMTKIKNRNLDSAYEIYLSLYHQLAGDEDDEPFRQLQPDFFDLIIVDECHRGSAKADSQWRRILEYFSGATQIGMTATPKETKYVSNINYFGEPVYIYSLKQGIDDGFLAPYKVVRPGLNIDLESYRPEKGKLDIFGNPVEDRIYNTLDFDRAIVVEERTKAVAKRITNFLKANSRFDKTIVFCVNIAHAERMRQALVNENSDLTAQEPKYVMRITGDNQEGKAQLDYFIDEDSCYPVIVTTSELLSTGVDCKTCKLIVLDKIINSLTMFKQIIGRGTRLKPEYGKEFFTIMDFRDNCRLFADPDFDGEPIPDENYTEPQPCEKYHSLPCKCPCPICNQFLCECACFVCGQNPCECEWPDIVFVNGVRVTIINERVQYYDHDGKLTTESITEYSRKNILGEYASLNNFLNIWNSDLHKEAVIEELKDRGVLLDALREETGRYDIDDFDLICHIAFDKKPLTKAERANNVRKRDYFNRYEGLARDVLLALLDKYAETGIQNLEGTAILELDPFRTMNSPAEIVGAFGGGDNFLQALKELQNEIYKTAA